MTESPIVLASFGQWGSTRVKKNQGFKKAQPGWVLVFYCVSGFIGFLDVQCQRLLSDKHGKGK